MRPNDCAVLTYSYRSNGTCDRRYLAFNAHLTSKLFSASHVCHLANSVANIDTSLKLSLVLRVTWVRTEKQLGRSFEGIAKER